MSILSKSNIDSTYFTRQFSWLNFESFRQGEGFGFWLDFPEKEGIANKDFIKTFHTLLGQFLKEVVISFFEPSLDTEKGGWGNFCIEVWNIHDDTRDYEPEGKNPETARYLTMLKECNIEPTYNWLCECKDWSKFLPIMLDCVMTCKAPYSLYFYCPSQQFLAYFHHTPSFGIYYKKINPAILGIIDCAKKLNLKMFDWNDYETIEKLEKGESPITND